MIRIFAFLACLTPSVAFAQSSDPLASDSNGAEHQLMHHSTGSESPTEAGQAAFAAIQEIVGILESDPHTVWTKVNIDALRQHLIDMNNVTLDAEVSSKAIDGGMRYTVTGLGKVRDSIQRMVSAHAATMDAVDGWHFEAAEVAGGATLTVLAPANRLEELHGLGFIGIMVRGMHHQQHHLMLARGEEPHK